MKLNLVKKKYSGLDSRTYVQFVEHHKQNGETEHPFKILVSASGLTIQGWMTGELETEEELSRFAEYISVAWVEYRKLKKELLTQLNGGRDPH